MVDRRPRASGPAASARTRRGGGGGRERIRPLTEFHFGWEAERGHTSQGKTATHAVVYARLISKGVDYGVHAFMVQLR